MSQGLPSLETGRTAALVSAPRTRLHAVGFAVATALYWFAVYTYVPILSPYVEHLGAKVWFVGLVIGSYGFTQMLLRVPLGIWSDRTGRRKAFILAGIACATASSLGFALTNTPGWALVWRGLAGCAAAGWVAFTVLYASYYRPDEAAKAMGVISFFTSIGQMAAMTLGGLLAQWKGWHAPFWAGALGGAVGLLVALGIRENRDAKRQPVPVAELLRMGTQWGLLSVSLLAVVSQSITFTTMYGFTNLQAAHIGASKAMLSLLTLMTSLPNAIAGYVSGGWFVRRFGARATIITGFLLAAFGTLAVPLSPWLWLLILTQVVNGFGQGLVMPVLMSLSIHSVHPDRRATAMGFFQAIYSIGMCGGPFISGWLGQALGLAGVFVFCGITCVFGAWLTWRWVQGAASPAGPSAQ
ncbi:MFS transporter [Alicyclobacillus cellulosilyticus]|uniref:MFS transporter n=1 Tax=Alicyclobacillus cellulosilyticus TaxID=1003997 RepID=UPI001E2ED230|nr:MFS transporter [Alicyclobacillus cellulosilyticus]